MSSSLDPCLAVIPARGGSKGLPGKNVRPLAGLPLIVHSLRCAALVPRLRETIVSTDSEEIASVARAHGGRVPFLRPAELARDDTPMLPVLRHALSELERIEGRRFESLLLLDPTSPARLPEDIERAFSMLAADPGADGVVACSVPTFNPLWVGVLIEQGPYGKRAFPNTWTRRQDVPRFLRINGALYLWRRDYIAGAAGEAWWSDKHLVLEIPEARAFSIDDLREFQVADLLVREGLVRLPWLKQS